MEAEDLVTQWIPNVEELLSLGTRHLDNDWPFSAVPVMNGQILVSLAMLPTSHLPLPDQDFARDWGEFVDTPIHSSVLMDKFNEALDACMQVSAIIKCRRMDGLHPDEDALLLRAINTFKNNRETIRDASRPNRDGATSPLRLTISIEIGISLTASLKLQRPDLQLTIHYA